ncbi:hypothetical protein ACFQ61_02050 [Streptomyces sp. NPDC056500]|uniref:hypothetical protein n=1 Tax=Streptomyces sp. NPDC056500 TaxID=3345840 RepID=UPI00367754CB
MNRRTMARRRARAAERATRRDSLLVLLGRVQRGLPLTDAEATLLRAHVTVELDEADEVRRTVQGQQLAMQRLRDQLGAAHEAIREAEQDAATAREELNAHRAGTEMIRARMSHAVDQAAQLSVQLEDAHADYADHRARCDRITHTEPAGIRIVNTPEEQPT